MKKIKKVSLYGLLCLLNLPYLGAVDAGKQSTKLAQLEEATKKMMVSLKE